MLNQLSLPHIIVQIMKRIN